MQDKTMTFSIYEDKEDETRRILTQVYDCLLYTSTHSLARCGSP